MGVNTSCCVVQGEGVEHEDAAVPKAQTLRQSVRQSMRQRQGTRQSVSEVTETDKEDEAEFDEDDWLAVCKEVTELCRTIRSEYHQSNPFDEADEDEVVESALEQTNSQMSHECYDVVGAERTLAQAIASLEGRSMEHVLRIVASPSFREVNDRVAQLDASLALIHSEGLRVEFESPDAKFETCVAPDRRWFQYRLTVDIDAPLTECISTGHEVDLITQAQPLVTSSKTLGQRCRSQFASILRIGFPVIVPEVVIEVVRHVDHTHFGYVLEVVRSEFACKDVPPKGWSGVRPWVYHTNLWMPRGGGARGTTVVQTSVVDCTISPPQWFLNLLFSKMSTAFIGDLRSSAAKATEPGSPWAQRIKEDSDGFYSDMRLVEEMAAFRREVRASDPPGAEFFQRDWRLRPPPADTRPPSSRGETSPRRKGGAQSRA